VAFAAVPSDVRKVSDVSDLPKVATSYSGLRPNSGIAQRHYYNSTVGHSRHRTSGGEAVKNGFRFQWYNPQTSPVACSRVSILSDN
jgi:hypothetical protein